MRIIISSKNPVKIAATEAAFHSVFPSEHMEFLSMDVPSGVSDQPASDDETRRGAINRVNNARLAAPDADYFVGMEGGLEWFEGKPLASAWMVVGNRDGSLGEARTPTLPLPPAVSALLQRGLELGDANDRVFATLHSKQAGGAFGLLTNGLMTRESVYTQTLILALLPMSHELWSAGSGTFRQTPPSE